MSALYLKSFKVRFLSTLLKIMDFFLVFAENVVLHVIRFSILTVTSSFKEEKFNKIEKYVFSFHKKSLLSKFTL